MISNLTQYNIGNKLLLGAQIQTPHPTIASLEKLFTSLAQDKILKFLESKVFVHVSGYGNINSYVRAMPGMKPVARTLGKEFFKGIGAALSIGIQAYSDINNSDLTGNQRLGRASIALLGGALPPLGYLILGVDTLYPGATDRWMNLAFSSSDPAVAWLAQQILTYGGPEFEAWSMKPSWVDLMAM